MIAQEWHSWTTITNADAYETLLRENILPRLEATGILGYRGVQVWRHIVSNAVETRDFASLRFNIIFFFDTFSQAQKVEPLFPNMIQANGAFSTQLEPQATYYEVAVRVDQPQGRMSHLYCDDELRHYITANLRDFAFQSAALEEGKRAAAVAVTIVHVAHRPEVYGIPFEPSWEDDAAILLTRRSAKLKKHAGQWALPGGRIDQGERPEETALRELEEEVGLKLGMERIIGRLDDYTTRSGFTIKPVVIWGGRVTGLVANPGEVQAIHRIPIAEFMREDAPILQNIPESENPVLLMPVGDSWIAAPTAAILYQFREVCILGKPTRVAHFEQPYFAWK